MATRLAPLRSRAGVRVLHERVALLALGTLAAHGLLLLPDRWLHPGLTQLLVPFASGYRPFWTGLGICAGYGAAALSLTYYARRRLRAPRRRAPPARPPPLARGAPVHPGGVGARRAARARRRHGCREPVAGNRP